MGSATSFIVASLGRIGPKPAFEIVGWRLATDDGFEFPCLPRWFVFVKIRFVRKSGGERKGEEERRGPTFETFRISRDAPREILTGLPVPLRNVRGLRQDLGHSAELTFAPSQVLLLSYKL